jgi:hypothetical protein
MEPVHRSASHRSGVSAGIQAGRECVPPHLHGHTGRDNVLSQLYKQQQSNIAVEKAREPRYFEGKHIVVLELVVLVVVSG